MSDNAWQRAVDMAAAARARKVATMAAVIERLRAQATEDNDEDALECLGRLEEWPDESRRLLATFAGVRAPSAETWRMLCGRLGFGQEGGRD